MCCNLPAPAANLENQSASANSSESNYSRQTGEVYSGASTVTQEARSLTSRLLSEGGSQERPNEWNLFMIEIR